MTTEILVTPKRKLLYYNLHDMMLSDVHGRHPKDLAVLHETVSPDLPGLADIMANAQYLDKIGYGIHGLTDKEGNKAWAVTLGDAIFYQAGGVNERSIGIEQVSKIPYLLANKIITKEQAWHTWLRREAQLQATAKLLAAWHNADPHHHPLKFSDSLTAGVTSHWNVSQHFPQSKGHTDCWPHHLGGYYPILVVIEFAQSYAKLGYQF